VSKLRKRCLKIILGCLSLTTSNKGQIEHDHTISECYLIFPALLWNNSWICAISFPSFKLFLLRFNTNSLRGSWLIEVWSLIFFRSETIDYFWRLSLVRIRCKFLSSIVFTNSHTSFTFKSFWSLIVSDNFYTCRTALFLSLKSWVK